MFQYIAHDTTEKTCLIDEQLILKEKLTKIYIKAFKNISK